MKNLTTGRLIHLGLAGLAVVLLVVASRSLASLIPAITAPVESFGAIAPIAFVLIYAVAEVAFVPGSLLTLAAGALFGLGWGTVVAMVGATLGASAGFLLARYAIRRGWRIGSAHHPNSRRSTPPLLARGARSFSSCA